MTFESIIGQERAIRLLTGMLRKDRLPHALLFTGIDGIGRQTTAMALAMAVNCVSPVGVAPCKTCRSCRKVSSGNHPDIIDVRPRGAFIKIDQVRSLRKDLRFAPLEGGRRVIIINDAQAMNAEASNAMLKLLEEPPNDTHIILTAWQTTDLLPTIVSRCLHVPFRPLPVAKIAEVLVARQGLDQGAASVLSVLSKGSLGRALAGDPEQWMAWRRHLLDRLGSIGSGSIQALFAFSQALAHDKDKVQDALDVMSIWFRDVLIYKFCPERILNKDFIKDIEGASTKLTVDELLQKIQAVSSAQRAILRHANSRLVLDVMMMRLCSDPLAA